MNTPERIEREGFDNNSLTPPSDNNVCFSMQEGSHVRPFIAYNCLLIPVAIGVWWYWTRRTASKFRVVVSGLLSPSEEARVQATGGNSELPRFQKQVVQEEEEYAEDCAISSALPKKVEPSSDSPMEHDYKYWNDMENHGIKGFSTNSPDRKAESNHSDYLKEFLERIGVYSHTIVSVWPPEPFGGESKSSNSTERSDYTHNSAPFHCNGIDTTVDERTSTHKNYVPSTT